MKITVKVEVPERQDCFTCKKFFAPINDCRLFDVPIKAWHPCPACIEARKKAKESA